MLLFIFVDNDNCLTAVNLQMSNKHSLGKVDGGNLSIQQIENAGNPSPLVVT